MQRTLLIVLFLSFTISSTISQQSGNELQAFINIKGPAFSVRINDSLYFSEDLISASNAISFGELIEGRILPDSVYSDVYSIILENVCSDTLKIENFLPLGETASNIYITSTGPWSLARSKLFRPGFGPIGVILPDNAWELGFTCTTDEEVNLALLARRKSIEKGKTHRYASYLYPGGKISYTLHCEFYSGEWQNALKKVFRDRWLYDLDTFDNRLFERQDLNWIKDDYLMCLQFTWDDQFYDWQHKEYRIDNFLKEAKYYFNGYDVFGIWPTWPTLGLDERNQWEMYADLPGGLSKLKEIAAGARKYNTRFFIAYNPWDKSTRWADPYKAMARLIMNADADGVVLDTRGKSSYKLQQAADSVKSGVVMYSEGMAIPKDMPGIISGRVHDAIYLPPPLNLNKLIKPDFSIFRVCQLSQGRLTREIAVSLFNGIGIELNTFAPGRPDWRDEDFRLLGKSTKILRENNDAFKNQNWTPLLPTRKETRKDSIWANHFPGKEKDIYTVYSLVPEGYSDFLFTIPVKEGYHLVSLWHHRHLPPVGGDSILYVSVMTDAFHRNALNTREEGKVDCIAYFKNHLKVESNYDTLFISWEKGDSCVVYSGDATYQAPNAEYRQKQKFIRFKDINPNGGKAIIQLFEKGLQIDEEIRYWKEGDPYLISCSQKTKSYTRKPEGMIELVGGDWEWQVAKRGSFIPYPDYSHPQQVVVKPLYVDKEPISNHDFFLFIKDSGYIPDDSSNYLKHWKDGKYVKGSKNEPVIYVSYEDAQAYAKWSGKRLPTEMEWQYIATVADTNTVVGLFGNVWQISNDIYYNGSYYFNIIKGGSSYKPTSSWWYVQGGPQPPEHTQMLLLINEGFTRNSTVGFRCVADK